MTRPPGTPPPAPHLNPTRPSTLLLTALASAAVSWSFVTKFLSQVPERLWPPVITVMLLAIIEGITARAIKARIDRRPGTEPVDPLFVARLAALAKASSLAGAVFVGLYAGLLIWAVFNRDNRFAVDSTPSVLGGVVAAGLLVAAALWLEYACRVPKGPDQEGTEGGDRDDESVPGV